jgi:hypothetical protein
MKMMWPLILACLIAASLDDGGATPMLTAYDCETDKANFRVVDLLEPKDCPDPEQDYAEAVPQIVQILQTESTVPITGYSCRVIISKKISRCGMDSISYGAPNWIIYEQQKEVTPEECREAVKEERIKVGVQHFYIRRGEERTYNFFSHGSIHENGYCDNTEFISEGVHYYKSVEKTIVRLHLKAVHATADIDDGTIRFHNGLRAQYKDQVVRDAAEGTIVWDAKDPNCSETVSEVYHGLSQLHRIRRPESLETMASPGSIVMLANNKTNQYAGLQLRDSTSLCGTHCHTTKSQGDRSLPPPTGRRAHTTEFL